MSTFKEKRKSLFFVRIMYVVQGVPLFLPPPYLPMCQNGEKQHNPELATLKNDTSPELATPQKMAESRTLVSLGVVSCGLCHFLGLQVLDLVISESQFRTQFFSSSRFWHKEISDWQEM